MSDTDQEPKDVLVLAILRGFPQLDDWEAVDIAAALHANEVCFGDDVLHLQRGFSEEDDELVEWLADMGKWSRRLLETIDTRIRSMQWRRDVMFLFIYRTT
jgi:hypothetical protein